MKFSYKKKIILPAVIGFLICNAAVSTLAQYNEWRPISTEDIAAKDSMVESEADVEALFWEMRIDDSSVQELDIWHYVRVKIFSDRGREKFSKVDIPLKKGTKIRHLDARVIKKDGTTIGITEKDIFEREIGQDSGTRVKAKTFAVPNVDRVVIVEYRYKEEIDDGGASGMRLPLQRDIPVRSLIYYYKPYGPGEPQYQVYNLSGFKFTKDKKGFWVAQRENVPAFVEEKRMPPVDMVRPWLLLTSYRTDFISRHKFMLTFIVKDPTDVNEYWKSFSGEKSNLVKLIKKTEKKIKAAAVSTTAGASTQDEKLRRLYSFVQEEIRNVQFDPALTAEQKSKLSPPKSIAEVLEAKAANLSDYIDWLFAAMAYSLGMDVRLAYMGNRSQIFFNPSMTNDKLLHFAGVAVRDGQGYKYFNPGDPFSPYGMISWHKESSHAILVGEKDFLWTISPAVPHETNRLYRTGNFRLSEDGTLEGDAIVELNGQQAWSYRHNYWNETETTRVDALKDSIKAQSSMAEVSAVTIENVFDHSKPVIQRYKVKIPNYAKRTGRRLFIQHSFFTHGVPEMFSSGTRKHNIFFPYPWSEKDKVRITIPAGFEPDKTNSPAPFSDSAKIGRLALDLKFDKANRIVMLDREFNFGTPGQVLFASNDYAALKNVFDTFHKMDANSMSFRQD